MLRVKILQSTLCLEVKDPLRLIHKEYYDQEISEVKSISTHYKTFKIFGGSCHYFQDSKNNYLLIY
jgi:hypothetical protein